MILRRDHYARRLRSTFEKTQGPMHMLVRANPINCPGIVPGRSSCSVTCTICSGTGYIGGVQGKDLNTAGPPYNTISYFKGDIQEGHGLLGNGGSFIQAEKDLGLQEVGDATMFMEANQTDPVTGKIVLPAVGFGARPDRIIRTPDGQVFTVLKMLQNSIGANDLSHVFALGIGYQSGSGTTA